MSTRGLKRQYTAGLNATGREYAKNWVNFIVSQMSTVATRGRREKYRAVIAESSPWHIQLSNGALGDDQRRLDLYPAPHNGDGWWVLSPPPARGPVLPTAWPRVDGCRVRRGTRDGVKIWGCQQRPEICATVAPKKWARTALNLPTRLDFFVKLKCHTCTTILSLGVRYFRRDLSCGVT